MCSYQKISPQKTKQVFLSFEMFRLTDKSVKSTTFQLYPNDTRNTCVNFFSLDLRRKTISLTYEPFKKKFKQ